MVKKIERSADFWPCYPGKHKKSVTRALHYFGAGLGIGLLIAALARQIWWLIAVALFSGYLFAWIGHFLIEKNRPATFTYPLWSLAPINCRD